MLSSVSPGLFSIANQLYFYIIMINSNKDHFNIQSYFLVIRQNQALIFSAHFSLLHR